MPQTEPFLSNSGNPNGGEVLTWDDYNDVWMPSENTLEKLSDVIAPHDLTAVKNVMVYDAINKKYKLTDIGMSYLKDADTSNASNGQFLKYDGTNWTGASIAITELSDVNANMSTVANKFLMSDGTEWTSSYINLKDLNDVDAGLAEGKILIGKSGGARFSTRFYIGRPAKCERQHQSQWVCTDMDRHRVEGGQE